MAAQRWATLGSVSPGADVGGVSPVPAQMWAAGGPNASVEVQAGMRPVRCER